MATAKGEPEAGTRRREHRGTRGDRDLPGLARSRARTARAGTRRRRLLGWHPLGWDLLAWHPLAWRPCLDVGGRADAGPRGVRIVMPRRGRRDRGAPAAAGKAGEQRLRQPVIPEPGVVEPAEQV